MLIKLIELFKKLRWGANIDNFISLYIINRKNLILLKSGDFKNKKLFGPAPTGIGITIKETNNEIHLLDRLIINY